MGSLLDIINGENFSKISFIRWGRPVADQAAFREIFGQKENPTEKDLEKLQRIFDFFCDSGEIVVVNTLCSAFGGGEKDFTEEKCSYFFNTPVDMLNLDYRNLLIEIRDIYRKQLPLIE